MAEKRHLKKFENANNYDSEKDSLMEKPYVVLLANTGEVVFEGEQDEPTVRDYSLEYFTIENTGNTTADFGFSGGHPYTYSLDGGEWVSSTRDSFTIQPQQSIRVKNTDDSSPIVSKQIMLRGGSCIVYGNIMSLIYGDNFVGKTDLSGYSYAFDSLFESGMDLTDASNLILPPGRLDSYVYQDMFKNCTKLVQGPDLLAEHVVHGAYAGIFNGCTSLKYITMLGKTCDDSTCFAQWVDGVASGGTIELSTYGNFGDNLKGLDTLLNNGWTISEM
jgi:hypothetical protein